MVHFPYLDRLSFGFHNPNHAAALVCALLPLCFGWRRAVWVGRGLAAGLFAALLLTQSRTGLLVATLEGATWWAMRRGNGGFHISDLRGRMGFRSQRAVFGDRALAWLGKLAVVALAVGLSLWWLGPRLALDGSILNRPKIWLAGLRLFAANPDGVGLGNSGALASAFLLPGDVPEVRTLVSSHLTLLAECGWLVGWAYFAFLALALCGVRRSPRVGLAFAGLVLSACSASVFDWPVLFGCAAQGGLGGTNLALSWLTLALFAAFGAWLLATNLHESPRIPIRADSCQFVDKTIDKIVTTSPSNPVRKTPCLPFSVTFVFSAAGLAGVLVLAARCVPPGDAPRVQGGYAASGADALVPVRPVTRFPRGLDLSSVRCVLLFGDCREWAYLVPKGVPVTCAED